MKRTTAEAVEALVLYLDNHGDSSRVLYRDALYDGRLEGWTLGEEIRQLAWNIRNNQ